MTNIVQSRGGSMVKTDLDRSAFTVRSSDPVWTKAIQNNARYFSLDLAKRNIERQRQFAFTIGITETLLNIADLARLAEATAVPDELIVETWDAVGRLASRRVLRDLQFQFSGNGYAAFASHEVPVVKLMYDCTLAESEYMQVQI